MRESVGSGKEYKRKKKHNKTDSRYTLSLVVKSPVLVMIPKVIILEVATSK